MKCYCRNYFYLSFSTHNTMTAKKYFGPEKNYTLRYPEFDNIILVLLLLSTPFKPISFHWTLCVKWINCSD